MYTSHTSLCGLGNSMLYFLNLATFQMGILSSQHHQCLSVPQLWVGQVLELQFTCQVSDTKMNISSRDLNAQHPAPTNLQWNKTWSDNGRLFSGGQGQNWNWCKCSSPHSLQSTSQPIRSSVKGADSSNTTGVQLKNMGAVLYFLSARVCIFHLLIS